MKPELQIHRRNSLRLQEYDYSRTGWYYVTICSYSRDCFLGKVVDDRMKLSRYGEVVEQVWLSLAKHYKIDLDMYVTMPNHFHGIIIVEGQPVGAIHESPLLQTHRILERRKMLLPKIIGRFKMTSAKEINICREASGVPVWQRGYYDHVIRNDADLHRIRRYIQNNPLKWALDEYNPEYSSRSSVRQQVGVSSLRTKIVAEGRKV